MKKAILGYELYTDPITIGVVQEGKHTTYTVYIRRGIGNSPAFVNLMYLLTVATADDTFHIKLSSPGGAIGCGINLVTLMLSTKAHVITEAVGGIASMAFLIWAAGKEVRITPGVLMMFHNISTFQYGQVVAIGKSIETLKQTANMVSKALVERGVLTEEETNKYHTSDTDVYISYTDMKDRLDEINSKQFNYNSISCIKKEV